MKKIKSETRLTMKRPSISSAGGRKEISHGVTMIVKMRATATTMSKTAAARLLRGSMMYQAFRLSTMRGRMWPRRSSSVSAADTFVGLPFTSWIVEIPAACQLALPLLRVGLRLLARL